MREVDERPNRLFYILLTLAFIAYFCFAAVPLSKELSLRPAWARNVYTYADPSKDSSSVVGALSFLLGDRYGSIAQDGTVFYSRPVAFDAAVSDAATLPYTKDSSALSILNPRGDPVARIQDEGWPFFRSGRLFLASPEMTSISEYDLSGKRLWSYDYPISITEFDAASSLSLAGLLDGTIECVDSKGKTFFAFAPGGSRIEVILGAALDQKEEAIATVCGVDRQRFVLLVRKGDTFKVQYHKYLDSDYREPVSVRFTQDGRYVLYRQPEGIAVFDRSTGMESLLPVRALNFEIASDPVRGLQFIFAKLNRSRALVCFQPPSRVIFYYTLPDGASWSRFADGNLYLGIGDTIGRMNITEE